MKSPSQSVLPQVPDTAVWNSEEGAGERIDLMALARSFVARWPLLLLAVVGGGVLFYALSFLVTPEYESSAVFLPPTNRPVMSDNPLAALMMGTPNTGTLYPGLLKSNSVVDAVLHDLDLEKVYKARDIERARAILRRHTHVSSDAAGFYTVAVDDPDPSRAKAIADKYMEALTQINARLAVDQANQERMIYEHELADAKDDLEKAEAALARMEESSGVVSAQTQTLAGLAAINQLRAQITAYQVQLAALRQAETEQAPAVVKMQAQIGALQAELQTMEKGNGGGAGAGLSAARAPQVNLEFLHLQQEVRYQQSLYDILAKQFESAQLEAISTPGAQVVDYPELPLRKATPRRKLWALVGAGLGFFAVTFVVFLEDRYRVMRDDPERRQELTTLVEAARRPSWRL